MRLLLAAGVLPMFVDHQWAGVGSVLLAWIAFRHRAWWLLLVGLAAVCWANHSGWALLAIPVVLLATRMPGQLPRCRWAFLRVLRGGSGVSCGIHGSKRLSAHGRRLPRYRPRPMEREGAAADDALVAAWSLRTH